MFKNLEDMQKVTKEQFDAVSGISSTVSKGFQQIATETAEYTKKSFESASAVAEKLVGAKSFEAAVEVQTEYAKSAYEAFVAQAKKMGDLYASLAKDTFKPVEMAVAKAQSAKK